MRPALQPSQRFPFPFPVLLHPGEGPLQGWRLHPHRSTIPQANLPPPNSWSWRPQLNLQVMGVEAAFLLPFHWVHQMQGGILLYTSRLLPPHNFNPSPPLLWSLLSFAVHSSFPAPSVGLEQLGGDMNTPTLQCLFGCPFQGDLSEPRSSSLDGSRSQQPSSEGWCGSCTLRIYSSLLIIMSSSNFSLYSFSCDAIAPPFLHSWRTIWPPSWWQEQSGAQRTRPATLHTSMSSVISILSCCHIPRSPAPAHCRVVILVGVVCGKLVLRTHRQNKHHNVLFFFTILFSFNK